MRKQCVPGASPFFARAGDEASMGIEQCENQEQHAGASCVYTCAECIHIGLH